VRKFRLLPVNYQLLRESKPAFEEALLASSTFAGYLQRTEWNVRDTDGTVVFTFASKVAGGSLRTIDFAKKHGKPWVHISRQGPDHADPAVALQRFIQEHGIEVLNVAGSRESKEPGLHRWAMRVINDAFFLGGKPPRDAWRTRVCIPLLPSDSRLHVTRKEATNASFFLWLVNFLKIGRVSIHLRRGVTKFQKKYVPLS
jgi:hypothetical protein